MLTVIVILIFSFCQLLLLIFIFFFKFFNKVDCDSLDNLIIELEDKNYLNLIEDLHLSLVRGHFKINHHHIKSAIESIKKNTSIYNQFNVCLSELVLFKNENQSKCFLCLLDKSDLKLDLNKLGFHKSLRDSFLQFDFNDSLNSIEEFRFHVSLGWCEAKYEHKLAKLIEQLNNQKFEPILIKVKEFKVNIGNLEHKFYLKE